MSNTVSDDYFSFMSAKAKPVKAEPTPAKPLKAGPVVGSPLEGPIPRSVMPTDIVDYVEEPTIEVTESFVSDTTIQRIFKQFAAPDGVPANLDSGDT